MKTHYKKTSHLNYIIWISIQIPHPDQRFFQKQRTASLDLVFQKPLKTGGFHKRTSNKLVVLMVNYYLFIYLFIYFENHGDAPENWVRDFFENHGYES
jgi:hypothetical protein